MFLFDIDGFLFFYVISIDPSFIDCLFLLQLAGHLLIFSSARQFRDLFPVF
ncbi:hydrolase, partial [Staphylococcus aureus]|nr:hydrolase [Staphylococcus aureus]